MVWGVGGEEEGGVRTTEVIQYSSNTEIGVGSYVRWRFREGEDLLYYVLQKLPDYAAQCQQMLSSAPKDRALYPGAVPILRSALPR